MTGKQTIYLPSSRAAPRIKPSADILAGRTYFSCLEQEVNSKVSCKFRSACNQAAAQPRLQEEILL
jgi:hypothetical protein